MSDQFALKAQLGMLNLLCLGSKQIYAHPQSLIDPIGFQAALQDPGPPSDSIDGLVESWHSRVSTFINKIAPQCPLHPCTRLALWYTDEVRTEMARADVSACM